MAGAASAVGCMDPQTSRLKPSLTNQSKSLCSSPPLLGCWPPTKGETQQEYLWPDYVPRKMNNFQPDVWPKTGFCSPFPFIPSYTPCQCRCHPGQPYRLWHRSTYSMWLNDFPKPKYCQSTNHNKHDVIKHVRPRIITHPAFCGPLLPKCNTELSCTLHWMI